MFIVKASDFYVIHENIGNSVVMCWFMSNLIFVYLGKPDKYIFTKICLNVNRVA